MKHDRLLFFLLLMPPMVWGDFFFTGVMQKSTGYSEQILLSRAKLAVFEESIKEGWQEGYAVTNLSHAPHKWNAVLSKGTSVAEQVQVRRRQIGDFTEALRHYMVRGFEIVEVENGVGSWMAILQKGGAFHHTTFVQTRDIKKMLEVITIKIKEGFKPIDIEEAEGYQVVLFAKKAPFTKAYYAHADNWDEVEVAIDKAWKSHWNIQAMEYGDNGWDILFAHYPSQHAEMLIRNRHFRKFRRSVRRGWREGYRLTDLAEARQ